MHRDADTDVFAVLDDLAEQRAVADEYHHMHTAAGHNAKAAWYADAAADASRRAITIAVYEETRLRYAMLAHRFDDEGTD